MDEQDLQWLPPPQPLDLTPMIDAAAPADESQKNGHPHVGMAHMSEIGQAELAPPTSF
jgi:hypothetical protein